ncbi:hypothetical protein [Deinococcus peraridilitoris]|uniref:Uncharacterized protein n=1 Tax=Deinococcus peraridilitoris (strain DSM 19664 / LMG 22246 / CIP 109416 / KR-200) TaxID=937777 RepID=L0A6S6_DEIPD|nr:hypothetical protein [Deinococcus peraridilitoris]AFZ68892.1 hypothetical protein Deipe_3459 [Deinococcus peraridilitoris DSM 19664]
MSEETEQRLHELMHAEVYWTARAMREQGSHFFQKLGEALERADAHNRRKIYQTWTEELLDFYRRGLQLAATEE